MPTARWKKLIIPVSILLFPVLLWLIITTGHNRFRHLPILGPVDINQHGDSSFHKIGAFSFTNQDHVTISDKSLEDKIFVANFFFASCKTVCPEMNAQVARVQHKFKDEKNIRFLSFTVDPEHDSVEVLTRYAEKMGADDRQWWFLTGNKDSIYSLAREDFLVPAAEGKTADDFFHSQDLILIDKEKRIRGIYDGTEAAEVDTLMDEINVLLHEYVEK